jgi:hypothetical protein
MVRLAEAQLLQDAVPNEFTVLEPVPKQYCTKRIQQAKDGVKIIANRISKEFRMRPVRFDTPQDFFHQMEELNNNPYKFIVRGHPSKTTDLECDVRRIVRGDGTGTLLPAVRRWVTLDIDGVTAGPDCIIPFEFSPDEPEEMALAVVDLLPGIFQGVSFHWRYSSSMGFKGDLVRLHLSFVLDTAISDDDLKRYFNTFNESFFQVHGRRLVDPALFNPIQPHYTAAPVLDGVTDPLNKRSGTYHVEQEVVALSNEWIIDEGTDETARRYIEFFDRIGDDKDGFHHPIMQGVASWINHHGEPEAGGRSELKRLVRSYIDDANVKERSTSEMDRYKSDPFLDHLIDGAINKGFARGTRAKVDVTELLDRYLYVSNEDMFYDPDRDLMFTREAVKNTHASMAPGKNVVKIMLESPDMKVVDMLSYVPGCEEDLTVHRKRKIYNTWKGHAIQPSDVADDVSVFTNHLKYLTDGDEDGYDHLSKWLAHTIARPGKKIRHAVVIGSSKEGTGKSYLKYVLKGIIGQRNVNEVNTNSLKEQFNSWVADTEIVFVEELMVAGRLEVANQLKPLISEEEVAVRKMRTDTFIVDNTANFMCTTNHRDAMLLTADTRRYWVWFSDQDPMTPTYYNHLFKWTKDNLAQIARWAEDMDLSKFDPDAPPPKTKSLYEMAEANVRPLHAYLQDQIDAEDWPMKSDLVVVSDLLQSIKQVPGLGRVGSVSLSNALKELGCKNLGQKRFMDGSKPRVWAVRNYNEWATAEESDISEHYRPPGSYENKGLDF